MVSGVMSVSDVEARDQAGQETDEAGQNDRGDQERRDPTVPGARVALGQQLALFGGTRQARG